MRILDAHAARFDANDPVRLVAELEHVAGEALDREVLVDRADLDALRFEQHGVVGHVGNRAAGGRRRHHRVAPAAHGAADDVAVQIRTAHAAAAREAFREHLHHVVEALARQARIRRGAREARVERVLAPFRARDFGDDLLGEHVERRLRNPQRVEFAAAHAVEQRRAFDELVARQRKQPALRHAADVVSRAADALQERRDPARRTDLADEIDIADVDAEFERCGRDEQLQFAALEPLLRIEAMLLRETAVMRGDRVLAEPLGEMTRHPLGRAPRVDEHECRAMRGRECRDAVVQLFPHVVRHHRFERHVRQFEREIAFARVARIDDRAFARRVGRAADEKARDRIDRLLRGRQPDARQRAADQRVEPFERQREMTAALRRRERVDFVDDHRSNGRQHLPARGRRQQHVERFGRRHEDVRRALAQRAALGLRRVAGAYRGADRRHGQAELRERFGDAGKRRIEIHVNVVRQRFQRRYVEDERRVRQRAVMRERVAHEFVERAQKRGQRLAGTGRRGDERRAAGLDVRPRERLRAGRCGERAAKPSGDGRMKHIQRARGGAGSGDVHRFGELGCERRRGRARIASVPDVARACRA
ncbi:hypothetical protein FEP76_01388 [Burkholderia multivorans]|nr:hypothetical protein [Burkholderia multivorans]